jgi:hypothetical protein
VRSAALTAAGLWLWICVDWDLTIITTISIPVRLIPCVRLVRRRRIFVDVFVVVSTIIVDDPGVDISRL